MNMQTSISDTGVYLERMSKPLQEKLRVAHYIPNSAQAVLDVGCADGTVTIALAQMFPKIQFCGIDLEEDFIKKAKQRAKEEGFKNVDFEKVYLRDLLARSQRFDSVVFISVLHEFYSYGEGVSSILKALADAHELLKPEGRIIIRDMILNEYTKSTKFRVGDVVKKVRDKKDTAGRIGDFEKYHGPLDSIYSLNHFLLKYFYTENWEREVKEHYVPVTFEQYAQAFDFLGMDLQVQDSYLIPFLKQKWQDDFALTEEELSSFRSTGFLVARK
ncbi:MAG: methyltransferase domain-containing protein [Candidatus Spechtbacterales bacterium]